MLLPNNRGPLYSKENYMYDESFRVPFLQWSWDAFYSWKNLRIFSVAELLENISTKQFTIYAYDNICINDSTVFSSNLNTIMSHYEISRLILNAIYVDSSISTLGNNHTLKLLVLQTGFNSTGKYYVEDNQFDYIISNFHLDELYIFNFRVHNSNLSIIKLKVLSICNCYSDITILKSLDCDELDIYNVSSNVISNINWAQNVERIREIRISSKFFYDLVNLSRRSLNLSTAKRFQLIGSDSTLRDIGNNVYESLITLSQASDVIIYHPSELTAIMNIVGREGAIGGYASSDLNIAQLTKRTYTLYSSDLTQCITVNRRKILHIKTNVDIFNNSILFKMLKPLFDTPAWELAYSYEIKKDTMLCGKPQYGYRNNQYSMQLIKNNIDLSYSATTMDTDDVIAKLTIIFEFIRSQRWQCDSFRCTLVNIQFSQSFCNNLIKLIMPKNQIILYFSNYSIKL